MNIPSYKKDILNWLTGVACLVGALSTVGHYLFPEVDSARVPASVPHNGGPDQEKANILKGSIQDGVGPSGKGGGSLKIEIHSVATTLPTVPGGTATEPSVSRPVQIEATVQAVHALQALQFVWHLPRGVVATNGHLSGELGDLAEGETKTLSLVITTSDQDNRQIHLNVFRKEGDENLGDVAQFNTVPDSSMLGSDAGNGVGSGSVTASSTHEHGARDARTMQKEAKPADHLIQ